RRGCERGRAKQGARSRPAAQELQHALLINLVADGEIMVPVRNLEQLRARNELCELSVIARERIPGSRRDQHRHADGGSLLDRQELARAAHAGSERRKIALRLLGESAEGSLERIGERI